jgi:putative transposase
MPRRPRLEMPGIPMHLTHRGVNRAAVFLDDGDFHAYRAALLECFAEQGVAVHAYVLMTNHVHLLATPSIAGAISKAMSKVGLRYVPRFNRKHGRSGTLWEGRFKSCLVDSDGYLLTVHRYIELNPVRAAMVDRPEAYPWSSVHANLGTAHDSLVTRHPVLGAFVDDAARPDAYRRWLREGMADTDLAAVRAHLQQERALGSEAFQQMVARTLKRPVSWRPRGRPARVANERAVDFKR